MSTVYRRPVAPPYNLNTRRVGEGGWVRGAAAAQSGFWVRNRSYQGQNRGHLGANWAEKYLGPCANEQSLREVHVPNMRQQRAWTRQEENDAESPESASGVREHSQEPKQARCARLLQTLGRRELTCRPKSPQNR